MTWAWAVKKRDHHTCTFCGSKWKVEAHHIKQRKDHPELTHVVSNGITLCHDCHLKAHGGSYNGCGSIRFSPEDCKPVIDFVNSLKTD